jgi:hypothetical protein
MSHLGATLERLYGLPAGPCSHAGSVYDLAMATYTASRSWDEPVCDQLVERYPRHQDVLRTALENSSYTPIYADIFGFVTCRFRVRPHAGARGALVVAPGSCARPSQSRSLVASGSKQ